MNTPLVLLSCGCPEPIATLQHQAAGALASALGLPLTPPLGGTAPSVAAAAQELAALGGAALAPLAVDPGQALADGGHWAEALGAARQCSLLLVGSDQLRSGSAAAGQALLRQWRVPLLGLVQWGAPWDAAARRRDGLPWLGVIGDDQLPLAVRLSWQLLEAELA